jgi:hypothetical protein
MPFKGQVVRLSELIADTITGVTIIGGTIIGGLFETADTGNRIKIWESASQGIIEFFTGLAAEISPGSLATLNSGPQAGALILTSPADSTFTQPAVLTLESNGGGLPPLAFLDADLQLDSGGSLILGANQNRLSAIDFGLFNITTNGSGQFVKAHNLGRVPRAAFFSGQDAAGPFAHYVFKVLGASSTTITVEVATANATLAAGTAMTVNFLALA